MRRKPWAGSSARKGGYAGVISMTASPGPANARQVRLTPGTTLGSHTIQSRSIRQPCCVQRCSSIASNIESGASA